ncbi:MULTISPECIES: hypothetical protein [unclassified Methylobacterium]|uniref:hypothetical protein n=1 Tax=unclassified Methylobacterium TaxID=2615210 RepID=UPI0011C1EE1C|nr:MULTISPECIES: hypothetical protein [unclassified Methylobacterium]QEE38825.1 hypothetical protein FVA80_07460 [Methylobacterium sp. WL1]TXN53619.1 hypothetical protein FV241_27475 [Methylobacterium sp. WL2]
MELDYLRRLHLETAGRVSLGERGRPADRCHEEREALERMVNVLDDLAHGPHVSEVGRRAVAAIVLELIGAGY